MLKPSVPKGMKVDAWNLLITCAKIITPCEDQTNEKNSTLFQLSGLKTSRDYNIVFFLWSYMFNSFYLILDPKIQKKITANRAPLMGWMMMVSFLMKGPDMANSSNADWPSTVNWVVP